MGVTDFTTRMISCFFIKKHVRDDLTLSERFQNQEVYSDNGAPMRHRADDKIIFFEDCKYAFDLEDLLRASAEILGKGTLGTSYKVILEDGSRVVVKRLKEVSVGQKEFNQQMEIIGKIKHENVTELKAYFYSKDEKLHVYDYYATGSLSQILHGDGGGTRMPLDWDTRKRIVIGAARGLARIHEENNGKLVHGHMKCSNIFLNSKNYGCVSEAGLTTLMKPTDHPSSDYGAPEVTDTRKATQSSDVYSFGVVLLELLTGKLPISLKTNGKDIHLVRWIRLKVKEEWTGEVFDAELLRYTGIQEEMVQMLQIGMACVAQMPEDRPKMVDVLKMIENIWQFKS